MEREEVKQRLLDFIKTMGLSVAQFERKAGLSNGYIRNFRGSFGGNKFDLILEAFPELNREWITTGRGEMLLTHQEIEAKEALKKAKQEEAENAVAEAEAVAAEAKEVNDSGKQLIFHIDEEMKKAYIKIAEDTIYASQWKALYEGAKSEIDTLKMLLDCCRDQLESYKTQLSAALEQIDKLNALLPTTEGQKKGARK